MKRTDTPQDRIRVGINKVCQRYDRSDISIWRWYTTSSFPKPHYLEGRRYWWLDQLEEYDAAHSATYEEHIAGRGAA